MSFWRVLSKEASFSSYTSIVKAIDDDGDSDDDGGDRDDGYDDDQELWMGVMMMMMMMMLAIVQEMIMMIINDDDSCGHIQYIPTFDFIFLGSIIVTIFIIITSRLIASIHNILLFSWRCLSAV
jgi:hypothetical protein